jgi:putative ABC transport system permease protein
MQKQLSYVKTTNLGFNKELLVRLNIPENYTNYNTLKQRFSDLSFVKGTSLSHGGPGFIQVGMGSNEEGNYFQMNCIYVDEDFIDVFGIPLLEGNEFLESDNGVSCYINETALKSYGWDNFEGKIFNNGREGGYKIAGVVGDFNVASLHKPITPVCLIYNPNYSAINLKLMPGNMGEQMNQIKETWKETVPEATLNFQFFDEYFDSLYRKEDRQGKAIALFSVIALIITCLGLLGQIVQTCIARIKEIGVRKVNGAKISEVITLLNKDFVLWVIIAFIIATPIAYYAMNKWLENFAYKTSLSWWIFALAGLLALGIALLTVSWQSWRAATRNPVEALRYE